MKVSIVVLILDCDKWSLANFVSYVTAREPIINKLTNDCVYKSNVQSLVDFIKKYKLKYMPEYFPELAKKGGKDNYELRIILTLQVFQEKNCDKEINFQSVARTLARLLIKQDKDNADNPCIEENSFFKAFKKSVHGDSEALRKYINDLLWAEVLDCNSSNLLKQKASENARELWINGKKPKVESVKMFEPMIKQEIKDESFT